MRPNRIFSSAPSNRVPVRWNGSSSPSGSEDPVRGEGQGVVQRRKAKPALRRLFTPSPTHDYLTLSGRVVGPVKFRDDRASARIAGVMVGVPASTYTYHYRRDDGLWKFDWKRTCQELKCLGDPDFGY